MIDIEYQSSAIAPPVMTPEFSTIQRYSLRNSDRFLAKVGTGEYYATKTGELICTTLGSCVAACVRNIKTGVGGMNHFLLPDFWRGRTDSWETTLVSSSARYGNVAMERLINVVLGEDQQRDTLEIKIFGGARVLRADIDIGERNTSFVKSYLRTEGLLIAAQDLGGTQPRKLIYDPVNGDVFVKKLGAAVGGQIAEREIDHLTRMEGTSVAGEIDLFTTVGEFD